MIKGLLLYHYHLITFFPIFVPEKEEKRDIYEEFYKLKYCSTVVYMVPRA